MRDDLRFFIDRGMGSRLVPEGLRARGWHVISMDERYGPASSQLVADVDWIVDATERGEILIAKDRAIAKKPLEVEALTRCRARALVIASAQITGEAMLTRLLTNETAIARLSDQPGPWVLGVDVSRLHPIRLRSRS